MTSRQLSARLARLATPTRLETIAGRSGPRGCDREDAGARDGARLNAIGAGESETETHRSAIQDLIANFVFLCRFNNEIFFRRC